MELGTGLLVLGYLLGSFPTSVVVSRRLAGFDLRDHGSGNAGASNALRLLGPWPAALVLAGDVVKGSLAAFLPIALMPGGADAELWAWAAGLAAVVGHLWPIWIRFRGGKGVATTAGVTLVLHPVGFAVAAALFALVLSTTRRIAPASLAGVFSFPLTVWLLARAGYDQGSSVALQAGVVLALLIGIMHRANVGRLLHGQEPRIGDR